jgi:hypothetical protein
MHRGRLHNGASGSYVGFRTLCRPSPTHHQLSGLQRLLPVRVGGPAHAVWDEAVIGPCGVCLPERPLYGVMRS